MRLDLGYYVRQWLDKKDEITRQGNLGKVNKGIFYLFF